MNPIVLAWLCFLPVLLQAVTIDEVLQGTNGEPKKCAEKLEARFHELDPAMLMEARLIAAQFRLKAEDPLSNEIAQTAFKEMVHSSEIGSWQHILAIAGLLSASHQNGQHIDVIPLGEELLKIDADRVLKSAFDEIPPSIKRWNFGIDPKSTLPVSFNDVMRMPLALAYLNQGNEEKALKTFSSISNKSMRSTLANGEFARLISAHPQELASATSTFPDVPAVNSVVQHKMSGEGNSQISGRSVFRENRAVIVGFAGLCFATIGWLLWRRITTVER